jgi:hypothetical protein
LYPVNLCNHPIILATIYGAISYCDPAWWRRNNSSDPEDALGRRNDISKEHAEAMAKWLGKRSRKGVAGKAASNLFVVFVEVVGRMAI